MGFFSWKTSDTKESISNKHSVLGALPVYLVTPDNEKIFEPDYDGYGVFGGHDVFALLAKWNVPEKCTGNEARDRYAGIDLILKTPELIKFPIKFSTNPERTYNDLAASEECPLQGYFYEEDGEE